MDKTKLEKMAEVDIKTINKEELIDINDVKINPQLPPEERIMDYIRQVKNPYCYLDHGMIVKLSFSNDGKTMEECLRNFLSHEIMKTTNPSSQGIL